MYTLLLKTNQLTKKETFENKSVTKKETSENYNAYTLHKTLCIL